LYNINLNHRVQIVYLSSW